MQIDDLIGEITATIGTNDEKRAGLAAVALLGGFLKDVRRIADALTLGANIEAGKAGVQIVDGKTINPADFEKALKSRRPKGSWD